VGAVSQPSSAATSAEPLSQNNMSLKLVSQLEEGTLQACHAVIALLDRGGRLVALQRDDNIGPHNTAAAQRKAFTSLSTKTASRKLSDIARNNPESENLNTVEDLLLLGGGVPIRIDGEVIGAIGVAGAGGSAIDEGCALAALETIKN
jgi:uncharacterized protein GlcG (DUF336 family)